MLQLAFARRQAAHDFTQRLGAPQVAKEHGDKLRPAPEAAGVALGAMLVDGRLEFKARDELQDLVENTAYSIRGGGLLAG